MLTVSHTLAQEQVRQHRARHGRRADGGHSRLRRGVYCAYPSGDPVFDVLCEEFGKINAVVIGSSKNSVTSHQKFAAKQGLPLPFILLSDPELTAVRAYGTWQKKKFYGKVSMGVVRSTFIIDEGCIIEKVMPKVKPDPNAAEILAYIKAE